ncbi:MAG TPA: NAD(+) diphosphatase [Xanthobacteraceae bacterium]|nr:NAD(+) diphosphatase [Xanthobacteraceae bacterium]
MPAPSELGQKPRLGYTASLIDRMAQRRGDAGAMKELSEHARAGVYLIGGEIIVLKSSGDQAGETCDPLFSPAEARALGAVRESVFLGAINDAPRFGFGLDPQTAEALQARNDLKVTDLRSIAVQGLVGADDLAPLAEAKALLGWHARHRFCPNCGSPTNLVQAGWRRDCPVCKAQHFPRTDPVVIMLVIAGDRCVLGRSRRFAPTMWSCLAGFIEPGETIEEAVRREVLEEAGITCGRVKYFASQPWPFPSSLMIGCHAQALSDKIVIDYEELENARWFDRDELAAMLKRQHKDGLTTPPPVAIAHHIIRDFVEHGCHVLA